MYNNNSELQIEDMNDYEKELENPGGKKASNNYGRKSMARNPYDPKSDNENEPLPNIPLRSSHINLEVMKVRPKKTLFFVHIEKRFF